MKLIILSFSLILFLGCSGSNGDNVPTQDDLQKDLKTIMTPNIPTDVVVKPDTVLQDSLSTDTLPVK